MTLITLSSCANLQPNPPTPPNATTLIENCKASCTPALEAQLRL